MQNVSRVFPQKNYDEQREWQTAWAEDYVLDDDICHQIIKAGELSPTEDFVSAIKAEDSRYVYWQKKDRTAPHGVGSRRTNDFWGDHNCKLITLYEFFGGSYGLGRRNPSRENLEGSVGSPFCSFAIEINKALSPEYRCLTDNRREFTLAKRMTPTQIAKTQKLSRELWEKYVVPFQKE